MDKLPKLETRLMKFEGKRRPNVGDFVNLTGPDTCVHVEIGGVFDRGVVSFNAQSAVVSVKDNDMVEVVILGKSTGTPPAKEMERYK